MARATKAKPTSKSTTKVKRPRSSPPRPGANAASKRARPVVTKPTNRYSAPPSIPPAEVRTLRELFWQNVLREMMSGFVVASMKLHAHSQPNQTNPPPPPTPEELSLLDGRVGLITRRGNRIPIASIFPVFSATSGKTARQRAISAAVEGTVLQVITPAGEVYTLPLHEVRGFHALSEDLMKQLEGIDNTEGPDHGAPFGFAAFTSLARSDEDDRSDSPGAPHQGAD